MNTLVKLPQGEWINLNGFRRVEIRESSVPVVHITWDNGDWNLYKQENAIAILQALEEAQARAHAGTLKTLEEKEQMMVTTAISMVALALLSEAIEDNGGTDAEQLVKTFTHKAKDFYRDCSQEELQFFMDKYFVSWLPKSA